MNKLFTLLFIFSTSLLFAQPANDECETLIDLGVAPFCAVDTFFTNVDATQSSIGNDNLPFDCNPGGDWITTDRDVWFRFVASDTIEDYSVTITGILDSLGGSPLTNPQVAVYRGECGFDELALLSCARAEDNNTLDLNFELLGLDAGVEYFVRINDWSSTGTPNSGSFLLCIKERDPISTIDQGGSTACTGMLFDDGGPNGDYSADTSHVFSICPDAPFNTCVTLDLEYFNIGSSDNLVFYDGPDNSSPVIDDLSGGLNSSEGGVCYTAQASSGCLTIELISDETIQFEGFAGMWECSSTPCETTAPITIEENITDELLIDALTTSQTIITIDTVICPDGGLGTFIAGDDTDLGLERGIILTTGLATNAIGPNDATNTATLHDAPGDSDLDYFSSLNNGLTSEDACVVELDVFVATDELRFEYIFGSEEYPEFVNSNFNDIFALLVQGPGIVGDPNIDNQQNVAIIPGTNTFVEINSLNSEQNWEYFRNNENGTSIEYDGLTSDFLGVNKALTASIPVVPCNNYKLKFAIADRGDDNLDSGVFIGELQGGVPSIAYDSFFGADDLIEDCSGSEDSIIIQLNSPLEESQNYNVNVTGTAVRDIDYILNIPDQITIPAGQTEISFSIIPITDLINEGEETIIISLSNDFGCGEIDLEDIEIKIRDTPLIDINLGADTALVCLADTSNSITLTAAGATEYIWSPSGLFDDNTGAAVIATPFEDGFVSVIGQLGPLSTCVAEDSIFLFRVFPELSIEVEGSTGICQGDTIQLNATNNVDGLNFFWSPNNDLSNPNDPVTDAFPNFNQTYIASIGVTGCIVTDTIEIEVNDFDFPNLIPDTTICQGTPIELANEVFFTTTDYSWTPAETIEDPTVSNALAIPQETTTYVLSASSQSDFCNRMDSVTVTVIPAAVDINNDTTFLCLGDSVSLQTNILPLNNPIVWSPDDGSISDINSPNPTVFPTTSTTYFATLETTACLIVDSVFIQVDSLPIVDTIFLDPFKEVYCPSDTVILTSPLFDPMDFPDLESLWTPLAGQVTPDSFFNLVILTIPDTTTYTRWLTNNACSSMVSVDVPVVEPEVNIIPDTTVCSLSPFQIFAETPDPNATFEWSPESVLSCADCPDPIVTVSDNINFTVVADVFGCPATGSYQSDIIQPPALNLAPDQSICLDESISLGNTVAQANTSFIWTSTDPNFASTDINPVVMPSQDASYTIVADNGICPPETETINIEVIQNVSFSVSEDDEVCLDDDFTLNAIVDPPSSDDSYEWFGPNATGLTTATIDLTANSAGEQFYTINFTNGCQQLSEEILVLVNDIVRVDSFSFVPFQQGLNDCFDEGELISISAAVDSVMAGANYQWTQNGQPIGTNSRAVETQILVLDPVTFDLQITTAEGCMSSANIGPICVEPALAKMPNAFVPGSNGPNAFFNIQTVGSFEEIESFRIWNRFGDLVYNNGNPSMGWDGIVDGDLAPSDVYLYHITIRRFSGEIDEFQGDVTLIR